MTKLNQIVAVEKGEKDRVNKTTALLFQDAAKPALFAGLSKTYEPKNEGGDLYPAESTKVKHTVPEILDAFVKPTTRLLNLISTKETANTEAKADVVVNGSVLISQAPVTFLLQLEKYLAREVRGLILALPVLDTAFDWTESGDRKGEYQTDVVVRNKTKAVNVPLELAPATDKHPAQVQLVQETIIEGTWNERKFSGAIKGSEKQDLLDRVDALIDAVKKAREEANDREVNDVNVGDAIFSFLLTP